MPATHEDLSISLEDAETLFGGRMGLIFGPGVSTATDILARLNAVVAEKCGVELEKNYMLTAQAAIDGGGDHEVVRGYIKEAISSEPPFSNLARIAGLRWSAALSLTIDSYFEAELSRSFERRPSGYTTTQVYDFPQALPSKTVPVFKLLGGILRPDFVSCDTDYVSKRPSWRYAIDEFADKLKDEPVVCLGVSECSSYLLDLIPAILSEPKSRVRSLLFIESDFELPVRNRLIALTRSKTNIAFIKASLADVLSRLKDVEKTGTTYPLVFAKPDSEFSRLETYSDFVTVVNRQLKSQITSNEITQLLDLLFSPSLLKWDPFYHKLDFRRSISTTIIDVLLKNQKSARTLPAYVLTGASASGKTTLAKRVAFDLAQKGHLVCWFRKVFYPNIQTLLDQFFKTLAEVSKQKSQRIYFFVDDPLGLGSLSLQNIAAAAQSHGIKCTFVIIARAVDWHTHESHHIVGALDFVQDFVLVDSLSDPELQALPNYLVDLKIFPDKESATREITRLPSRIASDTLGVLYWLLPKTRSSIEASIKEEYLRLGEHEGLSHVILGGINRTTDFLRQAYSMVAVADHYHTPLPIEVLVSALNVSYRDWMDAVDDQGAAWGILYDEPSTDGSTTCYRPRNAVVTRILIETINGGRLAHGGEVAFLLKLLRASTGTNTIYREFCVNILVPRSKLDKLEFTDGLSLYDAAINALPFEDRTLQHQKGLWIKDKGDDPLLAKQVLEKALKTQVYPYTTRGEAEEHIHTSLAATILDAADRGQIGLSEATDEILYHLDRARANAFFNAKAVHVQANLVLRLVSKIDNPDTADTYTLVNQAFVAVDQTLLLLRNPLQDRAAQPNKDIDFLEDISARIDEKILPLDELKETANEMWAKYRRQEGFVVAVRKLYHQARQKGTGTHYNEVFVYCEECMEKIKATTQAIGSDLAALAVSIYYEWNVSKYSSRSNARSIDWDMLYEFSTSVLKSERYAGDPLYRFVCALALAQKKRWSDADMIFAQIRRSSVPSHQLYPPRAILLDDTGTRQHFQGIVTGSEDKRYLKIDELQRDFYLSREERWPNIGEIAHAYIGLAFAGPIAMQTL